MAATKWVEFIRVRSSAAALQAAMPTLRAHVLELGSSVQGAKLLVLQHALYDGDLAVVMLWCSPSDPGRTREGLMVTAQLKDLGPVEHAVWIATDW